MMPPRQRCVIRFSVIFILLCLALMARAGVASAAPAIHPPWVVTLWVQFPEKDAADVWGFVIPLAHKDKIKERGICWSTTPSPAYPGACGRSGKGLGFFSLPLTGLQPETTYYARAYAISGYGLKYGNQLSFRTLPWGDPTAVTAEPVVTGQTTAILGGAATKQGGAEVLERGVCWSNKPLPDFHNSCAVMGSGLGSFSKEINDFTPGVKYYVRAYAASDIGTGWGQDKVFSTMGEDPPTVTTTAPYNETDVSALCGGTVTNQGTSPVTARGVCWSTSPNPTVSNTRTTDGQGLGQFRSSITGLDPLTDYYVRAYATSDAGTSYGEEYQFKTVHPVWPNVHTVGTLAVYDDSALLQGEVVLTGDATADERGFCWSTTPQPLITDSTVLEGGSGAGMYQAMLDGLQPETLYYARAFARNQYGVFYGHIIYFKTNFSKYPAR